MGHGHARHSAVQHSADGYGLPVLHRALDAVVLPTVGAPFRVADLGAAAGTNSLDPVSVVYSALVRFQAGKRDPDDVAAVAAAFEARLHDRIVSDPRSVETHWHIVPMRATRL